MTDEQPPPEDSAPTHAPRRKRMRTAFSADGWVRRFARLWGFLGFTILVVILARNVILPFVFALLVAYILDPIVDRLTLTASGKKRMPRGVAIVLCYVVILAGLVSFVLVLAPRISRDVQRIRKQAPALYQHLNNEWAPKVAGWLESRLPSLAPQPQVEPHRAMTTEAPLPPQSSLVVTPLSDGRFAVQLNESGIAVVPQQGGGFSITQAEQAPVPLTTEEKIRIWVAKSLGKLQSQLGGFFRFGLALVGGTVRSIFTFFLVLMVAAFLLLDLERIHSFARGLVPSMYRSDYDVIVAGVDRGLSGVIRGQLLICLVNGILTYIGLLIFSVNYSLILAVVAALLSLIPIFGSILSTIPIVLAAMVSGSHGIEIAKPIFIVAWIVGIHLLEANLLNPKIIGTAARIHPALVIFSLIVGEHSYGLVGALLAVPVVSIIQVLFIFFRNKAWREAPAAVR